MAKVRKAGLWSARYLLDDEVGDLGAVEALGGVAEEGACVVLEGGDGEGAEGGVVVRSLPP